MFPDDLAVFQYYKGIGIGTLSGLTLGWLIWRLPVYLKTRNTRRLRKIVLDMRRIEAAMVAEAKSWVPNVRELRVQRVPLRDRLHEWWQVERAEWRAAMTPRTPEQMAQEAQERELAGVL